MSVPSVTRRIVRRLRRSFERPAAEVPALVSMTLEPDDVGLARVWLARRDGWDAENVCRGYERAFAGWNGSRLAFSFLSGRASLSAAIHGLGLRPGDEVIVPAYTCVAVPNAFHFAGVDVVWADIELETFGLDVAAVEAKITSRTRAIHLQHLFGLVSRDTREILDLARMRGLRVIEDCAHATGAELDGRKVGTRGDVGFYSSEHSKVFNTIQGGVVVTDDPEIASRMGEYQRQAPSPPDDDVAAQLENVIYDYHRYKDPAHPDSDEIVRQLESRVIRSISEDEVAGRRPAHYGRRMPPAIAALGRNQLAKVDRFNAMRRQAARDWDVWCREQGLEPPRVLEGSLPVFLRYPVLVEPERKQDLSWAVRSLGVQPGVWFVTHTHPVPREVHGCPRADRAVAGCINLPTLV